MKIRPMVPEDWQVTGVRAYDEMREAIVRSLAGGRRVPQVIMGAVSKQGLSYTDAELAFHATRGTVLWVRGFHGSEFEDEETMGEFLGCVEEFARRHSCASVVVMSRTGSAIGSAVGKAGYRQMDEVVMRVRSWPAPEREWPEGLEIRPMRADEYAHPVRDEILPLVSSGTRVAPADEVRARLESGEYRPFVAVAGGEVIGHAENVFFHELLTHRIARVERVAVRPEFQGRGIGRHLAAELMRDAARENADIMELQVRPGNGAAIRTYQRLGFHPVPCDLYFREL